MTIQFFMPIIPPKVTAQSKMPFGGKIVNKQDWREAKEKLKAHLYKHKPEVPLEGALEFKTYWIFPYLKKDKAIAELNDFIPHLQKPDTDNILKGIKDCMTDLEFWIDDKMVFHETTCKCRGPKPGIYVIVHQYDDTDFINLVM